MQKLLSSKQFINIFKDLEAVCKKRGYIVFFDGQGRINFKSDKIDLSNKSGLDHRLFK